MSLAFLVVIIFCIRWWLTYKRERYPLSVENAPDEHHLREAYNYCGSGTHLQERRARGDKPINELDKCCMIHDKDYGTHKTTREADEALIECANNFEPANAREEVDQGLVLRAMNRKEELENAGVLDPNEFR